MIVCTTFKRDLEFSTEVLVVLVAHEIAKQRLRIRQHIECFRSRRAGAIAGGDIAHRVAARFARGNSGFSQEAQEVWCFFKLDVINLRVFARSKMQEATAKSFRRVREAYKLIGAQDSAGNLEALHLHALLALSVSPEVQTQLLHLCLIQFTGPILADLLLIIGQLVLYVFG